MVSGLLVIAVVAAMLAASAYVWGRALRVQLAALRMELSAAQDTAKNQSVRERELVKKAEDRHDELRELKQDVAVLRKKHHAAQEEVKSLRDELRSGVEDHDRMLNARPAFEPPPASVVRVKPKEQPAPAPREERPVRPEPAAKAAEAPAATIAPADTAESEQWRAKVEADKQALALELEAERERARAMNTEVQRLRHYTEQLRRIDIISKGKLEILEDRLSSLGRQYYESVSELAALKGEVVPPASRRERPSGGGAPQARPDEASSGEASATPESDELSQAMEAAEVEAQLSESSD